MNGAEAAFPSQSDLHGKQDKGLSKREYFAAMAMQAICASSYSEFESWQKIAEMSVNQADALILELNN